MSISLQPLSRCHSYLDHRHTVELAVIPCHRTSGSVLGDGARGHNLEDKNTDKNAQFTVLLFILVMGR